MRRVEIREAVFDDVEAMLGNVRQADVDELAACGITPDQAMYKGLCVSTHVWVGLVNDEFVCMFGVSPGSMITGRGYPWMVGTNALDKNAATFIRHCRSQLEIMRGSYNLLENFVDARNVRTIRWLRWLGFTIQDARDHGVFRLPFHRFIMES